jgi:hypothetical protein
MEHLVLFGNGWNVVERTEQLPFVWTTSESILWLEDNFEKIEIDAYCFQLNVHPITIIKDSIEEEVFQLVEGDNKIEIGVKGARKLTIKCNTFVPKEIINSDDPRQLGIKIFGIRVYHTGFLHQIDMNKILSKEYVNLKNQCDVSIKLRTKWQIGQFNKTFSKVYCISVMDDYARRNHAAEQYSKYGINFEFVPAISTSLIPKNINITPEEASLCLTSKMCLESAKINGYPSVVIMEDDFKFNFGWMDVFTDFQTHLPNDWDLLYLGQAKWWDGISDRKVEEINNYVDRIQFGCGAHFMAIRESIYDLCINLIGSLTDKLDICYWNVMKDLDYNCYTPKSSLCDSISTPDKKFINRIPEFSLKPYFPSRLSNL